MNDHPIDDFEFECSNRDTAFMPYLGFSPPTTSKIVDWFFPIITDELKRQGKRKRAWKTKDAENFKLVIAAVIANALRASASEPSKKVYYSRRSGAFSLRSYFPPFIGHDNLIHVVDTLEALDALECIRVESRRSPFKIKHPKQSTFQATALLLEVLADLGIRAEHVERSADEPVVYLKDKEKHLVAYDPDEPEVRSIIQAVEGYNDCVGGVDIRLAMSEAALAEMFDAMAKDKKRRSPINFGDKRLRRIFNNSTFDQGGRWYGGWWQNVPSGYRAHLLIDGEETIELDYSGCFIRMLYHREGIDLDPTADVYFLPQIDAAFRAQGMNDWEGVRGAVKQLMNILINASETDYISGFSDLTLPRGFEDLDLVYSLLAKKHEPIASYFKSGEGVRLMRVESDIAEAILMEGATKGLAVLPIHDSFVVQKRHGTWLREAMLSGYRDVFGFDPVVKPGLPAEPERRVLTEEEILFRRLHPDLLSQEEAIGDWYDQQGNVIFHNRDVIYRDEEDCAAFVAQEKTSRDPGAWKQFLAG